MPVNPRLLRLEVARQAEPILAKQVRPYIRLDFKTKKTRFLNEFEASPITQEIEEGPDAYSSIPALVAAGGNLFSFLGFYANQRPIDSLRRFLEKSITLGDTRRGVTRGDKIVFATPISIPTLGDIDAAMGADKSVALEWTGRPFTNLIHNGAPGYPSYLFRLVPPFGSPKPSRSGTAIEAKTKDGKLVNLRGGSLGRIKWIGPLLTTFRRSINPQR